MKWQIRFRQAQKNCCPPGEYWIVRTEIVEADSAESAAVKVMDSWRYNREIEIKEITEVGDDGKTNKGE